MPFDWTRSSRHCYSAAEIFHFRLIRLYSNARNSIFQLYHAVHNMSKKPLGLFWQFRPSTSNYNDTLYYNLIQDLTIRHKTSDRAERQFTQLLLSDGGQKKAAGKKPLGEKKSAGNLGRNHGSTSK